MSVCWKTTIKKQYLSWLWSQMRIITYFEVQLPNNYETTFTRLPYIVKNSEILQWFSLTKGIQLFFIVKVTDEANVVYVISALVCLHLGWILIVIFLNSEQYGSWVIKG